MLQENINTVWFSIKLCAHDKNEAREPENIQFFRLINFRSERTKTFSILFERGDGKTNDIESVRKECLTIHIKVELKFESQNLRTWKKPLPSIVFTDKFSANKQ